MPRLRVHNLATSIDGYAAGPDQSTAEPLGIGGERLHTFMFETETFRRMAGRPGGSTGLDETYMRAGDENIGAHIMGRNMFGPVRGAWPDESWTGWWGPEPPYHHDVFVLTHHERGPVEMAGGTTFHFVTDGIEAALERAFEAAGGRDVRIGGGASTVQQYLRAGLVDLLHVPIVPIVLGGGERLFDNLDGGPHGMEVTGFEASEGALHVTFEKR